MRSVWGRSGGATVGVGCVECHQSPIRLAVCRLCMTRAGGNDKMRVVQRGEGGGMSVRRDKDGCIAD